MDVKSQLEDLKIIAAKLFIEIQYRNLSDTEFQIQSGFCRLNGKPLIILDKRIPESDQVNIIIATLNGLKVEDVYLSPWIRERLEHSSSSNPSGEYLNGA